MEELRVLSPTGVCGSGFVESSFEQALEQKPHVIGCDGRGGQQYAPLMDIEIP
jgi:hypothetical protein